MRSKPGGNNTGRFARYRLIKELIVCFTQKCYGCLAVYFLKDFFLTFCTRTMIHSHKKNIWEAEFLKFIQALLFKEETHLWDPPLFRKGISFISSVSFTMCLTHLPASSFHFSFFFFFNLLALQWFGILGVNKTHCMLPILSPRGGISSWPRTEHS